jgi:hypothetical protein
MPPRKFYCQLRLAYSTKTVKNVYLLSLALVVLRQENPFKSGHFSWAVNKLAYSWNTFKAELCLVLLR